MIERQALDRLGRTDVDLYQVGAAIAGGVTAGVAEQAHEVEGRLVRPAIRLGPLDGRGGERGHGRDEHDHHHELHQREALVPS